MSAVTSLVVPAVILLAAAFALHRKADVFSALTDGAGEGLRVVVKILPALVALVTAVYMLRASGATDALAHVIAPAFDALGIPPELSPLILIRPLSGSGALAVGSELINEHGPDSLVGRTAAVLLGSTETTFYTIAVYFGAVGIKKTRYAIPAALTADFTAFVVGAIAARIMFTG